MAVEDVQQTLLRTPADAGASAVHRVLVAFDGSPSAWAALHQAIDVAVSNHALLTIAAVVHEPSGLLDGLRRRDDRAVHPRDRCAATSSARCAGTSPRRATRCPPPCR